MQAIHHIEHLIYIPTAAKKENKLRCQQEKREDVKKRRIKL
jgi:hypothetical protein